MTSLGQEGVMLAEEQKASMGGTECGGKGSK